MKETWKKIKGFPHYNVSNLGRVKILRRYELLKERMAKQFNIGRGYVGVTLYHRGKFKAVPTHKLVSHAFIGKCPTNKEVNHKNGNKWDPRLENLEYVSHLENVRHRLNRRKVCILSKRNVTRIRSLIRRNIRTGKIASIFGVAASTICDIKYGRTWAWFK